MNSLQENPRFSQYVQEIYNGTGSSVNLATGGYVLDMYFNGSATAGLSINLTGTVANGDVYVVAQSAANATILGQADQTNGSAWFNGDDAVVLRKAGPTIVDSLGIVGNDPGTEWGTGLTSTADNTLVRKATVCAGDTVINNAFDPSTEWNGFANDTVGNLGSHTADCIPLADYTNLHFPTSILVSGGQQTTSIYGRVFEAGVTSLPGASASVTAEVGYGPIGSDPTVDASGWTFVPASFNAQIGNDDEYVGSFTAPTPDSETQYAYTYRFSLDAGANWTYADTDGNGTNAGLSFNPANLGTMTVTPGNYGTLLFSPSSYIGDEDLGGVTVSVDRVGGTDGAVTVDIGEVASMVQKAGGSVPATGGAACTAGVDFITPDGTLNWADGEGGVMQYVINFCPDVDEETDEIFQVGLSNVTGGADIAVGSATITIRNDDSPRTFFVDVVTDSDNGSLNGCTDSSGDCSLRGAIATAISGDTIRFASSSTLAPEGTVAQTLTLENGPLTIVEDLTIIGPGASQFIIDANDLSRVINISSATVSLSGMTITGGNASSGGGIAASGDLTLSGMVITGNQSDFGGGIFSSASAFTMVESTVSLNNATDDGGGTVFFGGTVSISQSTFSENSANLRGGGLGATSGANVTVENSTFYNNTASTSGAGMATLNFGTGITVRSSTLSGNGVSRSALTTVTFANSILSNSPCSGTIVDGGYNIDSGTTCGFSAANNSLPSTNPLLGPLQNNGGPTFTMALGSGSPAIDQGFAFGLTTDQRGEARPTDFGNVTNAPGGDGSDIGAFESLTPTAAPVSISGRVFDVRGRAVGSAIVSVQGMDGGVRYFTTNSFGHYRFDGLAAGASYVVSVNARRHTFTSRVVSLEDNVGDLDFVADR